MLAQISFVKKEFKSRLLVKTTKGMHTLPIEDVAFIYIKNQIVFIKTTSDQRFTLEKTLDELEKQLDPSKFFRLNRQFMASIKYYK